eukprot:933426-Pelagomonas_calceolata.AAC.2
MEKLRKKKIALEGVARLEARRKGKRGEGAFSAALSCISCTQMYCPSPGIHLPPKGARVR